MIVFENNRIEYGDSITKTKIDGFIIYYETPSKGLIRSHLMQAIKDENDNWQVLSSLQSASLTFDDIKFQDDNILETLHDIYVKKLIEFNPEIEFQVTI
jgi:hypothetical protein